MCTAVRPIKMDAILWTDTYMQIKLLIQWFRTEKTEITNAHALAADVLETICDGPNIMSCKRDQFEPMYVLSHACLNAQNCILC